MQRRTGASSAASDVQLAGELGVGVVTHTAALAARMDGGLTLYGEWPYAKHTIFYDQLPHYFLEFDIRDATGAFWSTERLRAHLAGAPIVSVSALWEGVVTDPRAIPALVTKALYKSDGRRDRLRQAALDAQVDPDRPPWRPIQKPPLRGSISRSKIVREVWSSNATSGSGRRSCRPWSTRGATGSRGRSCRTSWPAGSNCSR